MTSHSEILSLARAGNPLRAWERFNDLGLADACEDARALTLKGRLLKDLGDRSGDAERLRLYGEASQAYLAANELGTDSYPLINAATLALLSQDGSRARELARQVLGLIKADPNEGETPYWREATRAEALLLLDHRGEAETALASGIAKLPRAWEDHAATIGQFERILASQGSDSRWLDGYRPAASVHFSGLIGLDPDNRELHGQLDRLFADLRPGFGFGALAAGADIVIAEKLVEAGACLHVTLPFARNRFRQVSVQPHGRDWAARFDALMAEAETIEEMWEVDGDASTWLNGLVDAGNLASMGQCRRRAETLRSRACAIAVIGSGEHRRNHIAAWQHAGLEVRMIETARTSGSAPTLASAPEMAPIPAILAVRGAEPEALEVLAQRHGLRGQTSGQAGAQPVRLVGNMRACLVALSGLRASGGDPGVEAAAGLVVAPIDTEDTLHSAGQRAARLAQAASPGALYADHQTAMVARIIDQVSRVEEMGEIGTLAGPLTVYAIARE